jgi:hypothetical protein
VRHHRHPPKRAIAKAALGADETVVLEHVWEAAPLVEGIRACGIELAAIETTVHAVELFDWALRPRMRGVRARGGCVLAEVSAGGVAATV